jgi:hypothetical protein
MAERALRPSDGLRRRRDTGPLRLDTKRACDGLGIGIASRAHRSRRIAIYVAKTVAQFIHCLKENI